MSLDDLTEAVRRITTLEGSDFVGPRDVALIDLAEQTLDLTFPPTYREFLLRLGCGDCLGQEFYGLIDDDFENSSVPDAIWLTLNERNESSLPHALILVGSTGDGGYYAIDRSRIDTQGESPVVEWWPLESPSTEPRPIAEDFGQFLLQQLQAAGE